MALEIYAFSLPAIAFENSYVPVISLLEHKLDLKMGYYKNPKLDEINPFKITLLQAYHLDHTMDDEFRITLAGYSTRKSVRVDDVYLVYRGYAPKVGVYFRKVRLLDDTETLKIVSIVAFTHIYQRFTGTRVDVSDIRGDDERIIEFVLTRRFITPGIIKIWNNNEKLKLILPYKIWVSDPEQDLKQNSEQEDQIRF